MPKNNEEWTININQSLGFCPAYFKNDYSTYGNKGHANDMTNVNLLDPNCFGPGPKPTDLTAGTEAGAVTTLITSILKTAVTSNVTYGIGGAKLYKFSNTAVTNAGNWPHTITGTGTVTSVGCDVCHYKGQLLYSYLDADLGGAGVQKGNIGMFDLASTFDDDWWTAVLGGAALEDAPHYFCNGGDDRVFITNGRYIARIDGTTDTVHALDFWEDSEVVSLTWNLNRVKAAVNRPNVSGSNFNQSAIYTWNGIAASWEGDPIDVSGEIGALYTKNGRTYVWWKEGTSTGGYTFGYIAGETLETIRTYKGSLPNQAQVGEYEGHLAWISSNKMFLWGAKDNDVPVKLFQYCSPKRATAGAFAAPFGDLIISSYASTNFSLAKLGNYTVLSDLTTKAFDMRSSNFKCQIDIIQIMTEQMSTGAKCDFTLYYDNGKSNKALTQVLYSSDNNTVHKVLTKGIQVEDFQIKIDHANGSATNPVKIRKILIGGHYIKEN